MITNEHGVQKIGGRYVRPVTLLGLSTDTKPTDNIANGSVFLEMDTATIYFFDRDSGTWEEWEA